VSETGSNIILSVCRLDLCYICAKCDLGNLMSSLKKQYVIGEPRMKNDD
jgi:hypothetical protein